MPNDEQVKSDLTDNGDEGNNTTPEYVTGEQLNKAITARFKDHEKSFKKTIGESLGELTGQIDSLLSSRIEEMFAQKMSESGNAKSKNGNEGEDPRFNAMRKEIESLKAAAAHAEQQRAAAEQARLDAALRQKVHEELVRGGVDGVRAKHALGFLLDADKRVRYEDGEFVFRDNDGDVPLEDGIKNWLAKSEDAKIYLPAKGIVGSGDRPSTKKVTNNGKLSPEALNAQLIEAFLGKRD